MRTVDELQRATDLNWYIDSAAMGGDFTARNDMKAAIQDGPFRGFVIDELAGADIVVVDPVHPPYPALRSSNAFQLNHYFFRAEQRRRKLEYAGPPMLRDFQVDRSAPNRGPLWPHTRVFVDPNVYAHEPFRRERLFRALEARDYGVEIVMNQNAAKVIIVDPAVSELYRYLDGEVCVLSCDYFDAAKKSNVLGDILAITHFIVPKPSINSAEIEQSYGAAVDLKQHSAPQVSDSEDGEGSPEPWGYGPVEGDEPSPSRKRRKSE
ncbi:hypothetical protein EXIGLDRAFT_758604 [Exidia glandulosa HHB12029]|uniref:Uncharacterized protein n=1 Tax=Exidia glandulosa HHB12029 TaxID=1314781 RepID=A0A166BV43_EXIGL|nr:hypothetical protein EXIGLDRAFT_758604 [Exidia glandulosa HHB12029]